MPSGFFRGNHRTTFGVLSYVLATGSNVALAPSLYGVLWAVSLEVAPIGGSP